MAINKKLIHFNNFSTFNSKKLSANVENTQYTLGIDGEVQTGSPDILYQSICYIKDIKKQWTHGSLYNCSDNVDFASDLTGVLEATPEEFIFRASAGTKSIRDESAVIRRIKGNTSVWGQYAKNPIFADGTANWASNGATLSANSNGGVNFVTTSSSSQSIHQVLTDVIPKGHKVLIVIDYKRNTTTSLDVLFYLRKSHGGFDQARIYSVADSNRRVDSVIISTTDAIMSTTSASLLVYPMMNGASGLTAIIYSINVFDLTAIFGAGNEPTTLEEFKKLYPESYYPYCEPEVRSMRATGIETIGFNEFDGTTEQGVLATDGSLIRLTNAKTSTLVPVISFEKYYIKDILVTPVVDTHTPASYAFYDSNETCVGSGTVVAISTEDRRSVTLTIPANASYMRVSFPSDAVGKTACINLSHSGVRDGQYEPYHKSVRMLPEIAKYFPEGMHGIGDVFDEINETSAIQRLGVRAYEDGDSDNAEVTTNGTNTVYVLAEPIVTPITEPLQLDYDVDDFGTERMLSDEGSSPFKADIVYQFNAEGRIRDNGRNIERLENNTKAIANETYELISNKQDALISGTNIKTINGNSILGSGNIEMPFFDGEEYIYVKKGISDDYLMYALPTSAGGMEDDVIVTQNSLKTINSQSLIGRGNIEVGGNVEAVERPNDEYLEDRPVRNAKDSVTGELIYFTGDANFIRMGDMMLADFLTDLQTKIGVSNGYPEIYHDESDTDVSILPNQFHVWDEVSELRIYFEPVLEVANEYLFQFTSGSEPTTLSLPYDVNWTGGEIPTIEANKIYQISILKGLGSVLSWSK